MSTLLQLRAWLIGTEPEIWRRLLVDPELKLSQLHTIMQQAFGWTDSHLHMFETKDGRRFTLPSPFDDDDDEAEDERKVLIGDLFDAPRTCITYEYDFGDDWRHAIKLEKRIDADTGASASAAASTTKKLKAPSTRAADDRPRAAICLDGARNGPPEDCGGPYTLERILYLRQNPPDPASEDAEGDLEVLEWIGDWNPETFDRDALNRNLASIKVTRRARASGK